jgi:plastocyanin
VQWQKSMDGGTTWANEPGATAWEWDLGARYQDLLVRAVFTNVAGTAVSNTATLTILHPPQILAQPADLTVVAGATVTFTASARCIVAMTRKWTITGGSTTDTVDGTTLTTTQSFTAKASDNGTRYGVQFCPIQCWDLCCTSTREATLTVASPPEITAHPASRTVAPGTTVTFTAAATGNPTPTAQWQVSTDGGATYADIAGATSASYTFTAAALDNGKLFRAKFTNSVSTAYTNAATLTVH